MSDCQHMTDQVRFVREIRTVPLRCKCGETISWWKPLMNHDDVATYIKLLDAMNPDRRPVPVLDLYPQAQLGPVDRAGEPALLAAA